MDVIVTAADDTRTVWNMTDLLGRSMGCVTESGKGNFTIHPDGEARVTMALLSPGPYGSLDIALSEIERHTRGTCRRAGEE